MQAGVAADQLCLAQESDYLVGLLKLQFRWSHQFHAASLAGDLGHRLSKVRKKMTVLEA